MEVPGGVEVKDKDTGCNKEDVPSASFNSTNVTTTSKKRKKKKKQGGASEAPVTTKVCNPSTEGTTNTDSKFSDSLPATVTSNFDLELEWCITQLQLGMLRPEANKSQKEHNNKNIKTLQSSKVPLPKKRQLMRSLFGNYRSKMKSCPIPGDQLRPKAAKVEPVKKTEVLETVGTYFRKSTTITRKTLLSSPSDCGGFEFDFNISSDM